MPVYDFWEHGTDKVNVDIANHYGLLGIKYQV